MPKRKRDCLTQFPKVPHLLFPNDGDVSGGGGGGHLVYQNVIDICRYVGAHENIFVWILLRSLSKAWREFVSLHIRRPYYVMIRMLQISTTHTSDGTLWIHWHNHNMWHDSKKLIVTQKNVEDAITYNNITADKHLPIWWLILPIHYKTDLTKVPCGRRPLVRAEVQRDIAARSGVFMKSKIQHQDPKDPLWLSWIRNALNFSPKKH